MVLRSGFILLAQRLQEAADVAHSNVRSMLSDAVSEAHKGTGKYAYYQDHTGDGESGDVMYSCDGDMKKCPYETQTVGGKQAAHIDTANAVKVRPVVSYQETADDDDHYASMSEAWKRDGIFTEVPISERFISKKERDSADEGSFAGKGKSFPILKPGDVGAAVHAMGRAGAGNYGMAQLKANIIRIAKAKGWTSELPKAWQGTETSEADRAEKTGKLTLIESEGCGFLADIPLTEAARSTYPIKLISPGTGSTAHYPADVLERDGPKVFKKGTLMFWNHPTAKEAAERPEGDLNNLAAITTKDAEYRHDGPKGPGLYAEAKVMADYAQKIEERAPHIGLSIRAGGSGDGSKVNGKPVLKSIDYAESVDYVTKAGRGGLALAEAARDAGLLPPINTQESGEMTLQEAQALINEGIAKAVGPLKLAEAKRSAEAEAVRILESVNLPEAAKQKITQRAVATVVTEAFDAAKFREIVVAEAKAEGQYLAQITGAGRVTGMGDSMAPFATPLSEADEKAERKRQKRLREAAEANDARGVQVFADLFGGDTEIAARTLGIRRVA